jgi:hypothetical protein
MPCWEPTDCRLDLESAAGCRRMRSAAQPPPRERGYAIAQPASVALNLCRGPQVAAAARALRVCGPCRSAAGRTSRPGICGSADSAWDSTSSSDRLVVWTHADAQARYRHHPEASFVNSLSVPTPRRLPYDAGHPVPASQRCSQSFGLRATKISAQRAVLHAHVRREYGESGDRSD